MNAIVQVVRCFEDADVHHVAGSVDPVRDIEVITTELVLADLGTVQKRAERLVKSVRAGDKAAKAEAAVCEKLIPHLDAGKPAITLALSDEENKIAKGFFLLTSKPVLFACNVAESPTWRHLAAEMDAAQEQEGGCRRMRCGFTRRRAM